MRKPKKLPKKQVEKFSSIFTQLGLVLVLFIVFITLEHQTERVATIVTEPSLEPDKVYTLEDKPIIFVKKLPNPKQEKPKVELKVDNLSKLKQIENKEDFVEAVIQEPDDNEPLEIIDVDAIEEVDIPDDEKEDEVEKISLYTSVQNKPIFAGCEGLSEKESKKCFDRKMRRLIQRYFDTNLANELGLKSGKHRITTQFVIDKSGEITNVEIVAPHPKLEKETQRVVKRIPKFTPGKQQNKPVKVKYTLPISFRVE